MKRIVVISTGGTIAMKKTNSEEGALPALTGQDLVQSIPELPMVGNVTVFSWKNTPSSHLQLGDIAELAGILKTFHSEGYASAVITHGTDTMEESAYLLDLLLNLDMGIVLTGSQRNPSLSGNDGPANVLDAAITAVDPKAAKEGVLVVFNGEVHTAREVIKTHTSSLATFRSPEFGPLAAVTNFKVHWYRSAMIREYYPAEKVAKKVEVVRCFLGSDSSLIEGALKEKIDGLIVESLGAGHVPINMMPGIRQAVKSGIPVILSSRCISGRLFLDTYGFEGSEKDLRQTGVIWGDALPGSKARIKLLALLAAGYNLEEIKYEFEKNFYL